MSKYIDAEKLKAEIERRRLQNRYIDTEGYENELLEIIDSLQQEQPDFPTTDEQMKEFLATHPKIKMPEKYKNPDWLLKKQEQKEADLDADIEMEWDSFNKHLAEYGEESEEVVWLNWYSFNELTRHFYELGLKTMI